MSEALAIATTHAERQRPRELRVRAMAWEACDVLSLTLVDPSGSALPPWTPGAHVDLTVPGGTTAQYSLCGETGADDWRIAILLQRDGRGVSRYVHETLRPGDLVGVGDPRNHFPLEPAPSYLFIAGGIGITPFLPMIEAARQAGRPWQMAYGGRHRSSMSFARQLQRHGSCVHFYPENETGLMPLDAILSAVDKKTQVYCCGPEPLIIAVQAMALRHGLATPLVERFAARAPAADEVRVEAGSFSVKLARKGISVNVETGCSIVDALAARGVHVPTSCREGVCGSCETRVLEGAIDHRDSILSPQEQARQDTMMVCVSRAAGASLTLDL